MPGRKVHVTEIRFKYLRAPLISPRLSQWCGSNRQHPFNETPISCQKTAQNHTDGGLYFIINVTAHMNATKWNLRQLFSSLIHTQRRVLVKNKKIPRLASLSVNPPVQDQERNLKYFVIFAIFTLNQTRINPSSIPLRFVFKIQFVLLTAFLSSKTPSTIKWNLSLSQKKRRWN